MFPQVRDFSVLTCLHVVIHLLTAFFGICDFYSITCAVRSAKHHGQAQTIMVFVGFFYVILKLPCSCDFFSFGLELYLCLCCIPAVIPRNFYSHNIADAVMPPITVVINSHLGALIRY